jgi:hypothetical protein
MGYIRPVGSAHLIPVDGARRLPVSLPRRRAVCPTRASLLGLGILLIARGRWLARQVITLAQLAAEAF